jgi:hypothetical protein
VLNFEFCFAVSVSVFRLVSMSPAKSKNGTESGNLPEKALVGWFVIFPTFVLHEEGGRRRADGRVCLEKLCHLVWLDKSRFGIRFQSHSKIHVSTVLWPKRHKLFAFRHIRLHGGDF